MYNQFNQSPRWLLTNKINRQYNQLSIESIANIHPLFSSEQLQDVRPSPGPESKMTMADFREKVISELLNTERDYVRDIKLCQEGFMSVLKDKQVHVKTKTCHIFSPIFCVISKSWK